MKTLLILPFLVVAVCSNARENPGAKKSQLPVSKVAANCAPPTAYINLNINSVRAGLLAGGDMWWDLSNAQYEVPVGSGKHSMFAGAIWIGGIDGLGQIVVAGQTYRQTGTDYWPGALDTSTVDILANRCLDYNRFWKINRQEVDDFISNGTTTPDIISWPGNGNSTYNEAYSLAPFYDANGDGIYNTADNDYPQFNLNSIYPVLPGTSYEICEDYLFGHQSIWWVINDVGNVKTETGSLPMGLEIQCQAFAYHSAYTSIQQTTFYKYKVINRSASTYSDTYFGQWVDPDLGNAVDDFVGCDVVRGLGYCYNGDIDDETASGYGIDPPAIGVDFLRGPVANSQDGIDNDRDGCTDCTFIDSSGTTVALSDAILPETISMSKFVYYNNINGSPIGNPAGFADFYSYLTGIWLDGSPITYGGNGTNQTNPPCNYMFPGTSDPLFPTNWTEITAGNVPEDRRFIQSAGPFTMEPGEVNYITTAVIWARETGGGPQGSVNLLQQYDSDIQLLFSHCFDTIPVGISENAMSDLIRVYPNPVSDYLNIEMKLSPDAKSLIELFNTKGEIVLAEQSSDSDAYRFNVKNLASGNYFCRITVNGKVQHNSKVAVVRQ